MIPVCGTVAAVSGLIVIRVVVEPPLNSNQLRWEYAFDGDGSRITRAIEIGILHLPLSAGSEGFWIGDEAARILVTPSTQEVGALVVEVASPSGEDGVTILSASDVEGQSTAAVSLNPGRRQTMVIPLLPFVDLSPFPKAQLRLTCVRASSDLTRQESTDRCARIVDLRWTVSDEAGNAGN